VDGPPAVLSRSTAKATNDAAIMTSRATQSQARRTLRGLGGPVTSADFMRFYLASPAFGLRRGSWPA
jgi:hypothetical protein